MVSVQCKGHPIIHSENAGLNVRVPGKDRLPGRKVKWTGRENGQVILRLPGFRPSAWESIHIKVQFLALSYSPTCCPV